MSDNLATARAEYEAARTPAVLAGLEMIRRNGGTLASPGDGQPCKIASLVAWAHLGGSHHVQAQFDRYIAASDELARAATTPQPQRSPETCERCGRELPVLASPCPTCSRAA